MSSMTESRTPTHQINHDLAQTQKISAYEQSREQRIKENKERMQKLGIVSLSLQLNSAVSAARKRGINTSSDRKPFQRSTPLPPSGPTRRSSRLQNATPVSYTEVQLSKKNMHLEDEELLLENGSRPEVYTEEHEKLLGSTERSWTLFVDGCGTDGKRIYDPVKGKTCHQCRQKTLGLRTNCSNCSMVQGQFCGDCLYMRYGEHVLEANENPNWICPVCRGICNCSLCRQAKGWPPTGALYRKILKLGFKSVAHYLIQTRRKEANEEVTQDTINQVSAKRSLPFSDMEAQSPRTNGDPAEPESEDKTCDHQLKGETENEMPSSDSQPSAKRPLPFSNKEALLENIKVSEASLSESETDDKIEGQVAPDYPGKLELESDNEKGEEVKGKDVKDMHFADEDKEQVDAKCALEDSPKPKRKRALVTEPSQDSIARRLKQRRRGSGNNPDDDKEEQFKNQPLLSIA